MPLVAVHVSAVARLFIPEFQLSRRVAGSILRIAILDGWGSLYIAIDRVQITNAVYTVDP
jgi:hypothetical protein